jgi:hypothetical protein
MCTHRWMYCRHDGMQKPQTTIFESTQWKRVADRELWLTAAAQHEERGSHCQAGKKSEFRI